MLILNRSLLALFARSTRIALVARMRAASNAHLKNRLLVRGMALTAQEPRQNSQVQRLVIRAKVHLHAALGMVLLDIICKQVEGAVRR